MVSWAGSRFRFVNDWYESQFKNKHGADRYYWENLPFWGKLHSVREGAKRAEDSYRNTGKDDYYSDRWASDSLNSMLGSLSAPIPGLRLPTMAKSLAKMYGAEVELNIAKFRHATQIAKRYNNAQYYANSNNLYNKWRNYQMYKHMDRWS